MDKPTKRLSEYVKEKGINLKNLSKKTGITYQRLYDSLSDIKRQRDLRAGEYIKICRFLDLDLNEIGEDEEEA